MPGWPLVAHEYPAETIPVQLNDKVCQLSIGQLNSQQTLRLTNQVPSAVLFVHQRSATVALAWIFPAAPVPGAQHFRVNDYIDSVRAMPSFANPESPATVIKWWTNKIHPPPPHLLSMTGTSTACNVLGRSLDPGFKAPHPAAQPNFPRKSSFFSGRQIGAETEHQLTKVFPNPPPLSMFLQMCGMKWTGRSSVSTETS